MTDKKEIRVYVVNADECGQGINYLKKGKTDAFITEAERQGTVFTLKGFQQAINSNALFLDNSWIYIKGGE